MPTGKIGSRGATDALLQIALTFDPVLVMSSFNLEKAGFGDSFLATYAPCPVLVLGIGIVDFGRCKIGLITSSSAPDSSLARAGVSRQTLRVLTFIYSWDFCLCFVLDV